MEHRCSVRKSLEFHTVLYKHGLPVKSGMCRNLGLGGMFVDTGEQDWSKNEYLEVEILDSRGHVLTRLPTVVVHFNESGAGLMFDAVTNEQRRLLRTWLFVGQRQRSGPAAGSADDREVA